MERNGVYPLRGDVPLTRLGLSSTDNIKVRIIFDTTKFFNTFFHKRMRFVYMEIFLYICNMENEVDLSDWVYVQYSNDEPYFSVWGIGDPVSAYHKIQSVKRLEEVGVHVTFYNRDKIIHNYEK